MSVCVCVCVNFVYNDRVNIIFFVCACRINLLYKNVK